MTDIGTPIATRAPAFGAIDLDVFTPSDDRAVRLVVGKTADQSTGNVGGSAGRSHLIMHPSTEGTASVPVDTPHAVNDDFRRIQVLGSINE